MLQLLALSGPVCFRTELMKTGEERVSKASPSFENGVQMRIHDVPKSSTWQIEREGE
jgi:hypothetical protein